ncbi:hypothetical protein L1987_26895 [Smallanthus sonchifolius]|uniref:Uncharacterized protein n=1 Tax=Smallanthus sonchifolius TaxID=185202 RepID=A0ACB9I9P0_9ASTR|nr:hypothetical protein L1987_26895 [Smallanthus sonchifolius]
MWKETTAHWIIKKKKTNNVKNQRKHIGSLILGIEKALCPQTAPRFQGMPQCSGPASGCYRTLVKEVVKVKEGIQPWECRSRKMIDYEECLKINIQCRKIECCTC